MPARRALDSVESEFQLELGKDYLVLGLGIFDTVLSALVRDETGLPAWLPIGLFEFEVSTMPADWEFALLDGNAASGGDSLNRWVARWGYPELVRDDRHSDGLVERDVEALKIFYRELDRASQTFESSDS